jgi:drug/metabolite transporter (DMT)-like permease
MPLEQAIFPATSAIFFGTQYVPQKKLGEVNTGHYNLSVAIGLVITSTIICSILFLIGMPILHWIPIVIAFLSGIVWSIGNRLSIVGVNRIGMSKATILFNLNSVFSFLFGILFYAESIGLFKIIGMPIIICGSVIVAAITGEEKKEINWFGILAAIFAAFVFSIFNTLANESASSHINPTIPYYVMALFISIGALVGNLFFINTPRKFKEWRGENPKFHYWALSGGFLLGSGFFISLYSLAAYGLSFTIPILQTVLLLVSAIWGLLYFKEIRKRKSLALFLIGAGISIAGIIIFSW